MSKSINSIKVDSITSSNNITVTRPLQVANGNVTNLSIAFSNDTNTGLYWNSTDSIGVATGGAQRMTIGNSNVTSILPMTVSNTNASTSTTTGALVVSGGAGISGALFTGGNISSSDTLNATANVRTGNLIANSTATSTSTTTGALVVSGGAGISGALFTGGNISSSDTVNATANVRTGNLIANSTVTSTSTTTGALVVSGGAGISGALFTGGNISSSDTVNATANVRTGNLIANSTVTSTSTTTGALVVTGGAGISGNIYVGGNIFTSDGNVTNPSISFSSDTNTGMYRVGTDSIGFSTNAARRLTISSSDIADPFNLTIGSGGSEASRHFAFINPDGLTTPQNYIYSRWADINTRVQIGFRYNYLTRPVEVVNPVANSSRYSSISLIKNNQIGEEINGSGRVDLMAFTDQGEIRVSNGEPGTPSFSFNNDTNTGMYLVGTDSIGFTTGNIRRMVIGNTDVSVDPELPLRVANISDSTALDTGALRVLGGISANGNIFTGGNSRVLGNIASTSTTTGALVVTGGAGISGNVYIGGNIFTSDGNVTNPSIGFSTDTSTGIYRVGTTIGFSTGGVNRLTIDSRGALQGGTYSSTSGYYALAKEVYPRVSNATAANIVSAWNTRTSAVNIAWRSIYWSPELALFVATATSGTGNRVMTSPDGITWTSRTSAADNTWGSVVWSSELRRFVAVAEGGTGRVMTSTDGITWIIPVSTPALVDNSWSSVCWAAELGLFVAVGYTGTGNRVMTSPDGINWTTQSGIQNSNWHSVCWSPELQLLVAVGASVIMTSSNAVTWTTRTSPVSINWRAVCWSSELSLFVAVANTGSGNRVMTSSNGITWTSRTSAADNSWEAICWAAEIGAFVAVATSGTGNRIMSSFDGITWTTQTNPVNNEFRGICWASELSIFVAVSNNLGSTCITSSLTARLPTTLNVFNGLNLIDGNVTNPAYSFSSDLNTGIFRAGEDTVGFTTGGTQRMSVSSSNITSIVPIFMQATNNNKALIQLKSDSGTGSLMQDLNFDTHDSARGGGLTFTDSSNANVRTFVGRAYMNGSPINRTCIIAQRDSANAITFTEARAANGTINRNSVFTVLDTGYTCIGEGNYVPFGLLDLSAMDAIYTKLSNPVNNQGALLNVRAATYQCSNMSTVGNVATTSLQQITFTDNVAAGTITTGSTLRIHGPPIAGTNLTITNPYALVINSGNSLIGGVLLSANGNVTNPQYSFVNDNNTGLYLASTDNIAVSTGGVQRMVIGNANVTSTLRTYQRLNTAGTTTVNGYYGLALDGRRRISSTDASRLVSSWQLYSSGISTPTSDLRSITWAPELNLLVTVGSNGVWLRSSDGFNWTSDTNSISQLWDICWAPAPVNRFVAVGDGTGPINDVRYSDDGITWSGVSVTTNEWRSVCFSPETGLFVAVSRTGTSRVMTSGTGATWTTRTVEANEWLSVCWAAELGLFVAVASSGTNRVMVSSNGATWTTASAAQANAWHSVCWSGELGLLVAVSLDGVNRVMTSINGITWATADASAANQWTRVIWSSEVGLFVAVAASGANRIMTSPNGITWTSRSLGVLNARSGIWSPELSLFVVPAPLTSTSPAFLMSSLATRVPTPLTISTVPTALLIVNNNMSIINNSEVLMDATLATSISSNMRYGMTLSTAGIRVPYDGFYFFTATVIFASNSTGYRQVQMRTDSLSGTIIATSNMPAVNGSDTRVNVSTIFDLAAGTVVFLTFFQNSGGNLNVLTLDSTCRFSGYLVSRT